MIRGTGLFNYLVWRLAFPDELRFWNNWLKTKNEVLLYRCDPNSKLQDHIAELLADTPIDSGIKILDVGAGPLTSLGKYWEDRKVHIVAVDPLAEEYNKMLKRHHIKPSVQTTVACAEKLLATFPPNYFTLVHARNSIDHSYDPLLAIQQMIAVVKPNCFVYLEHVVNEGENQQYQGFHQSNFFSEQGNFFVSDLHRTINITRELSGVAEIRCHVLENNMIVAKIRKRH